MDLLLRLWTWIKTRAADLYGRWRFFIHHITDGAVWRKWLYVARRRIVNFPEALVRWVFYVGAKIWRWIHDAVIVAWNWRLGTVVFWLASTSLVVFLFTTLTLMAIVYYPSTQVARSAPGGDILYLDQGWGPSAASADRQTFYYTSQGTTISQLRYKWIVNLEQASNKNRFIAPEHMRALGFFVDNAITPANPDQMPVGFTRHFDRALNEDVLDITCAACHTGELHVVYNNAPLAIRIDGGQAMHAFTSPRIGQFGPTLVAAMASTFLNPIKFDRFAHAVLEERYDEAKHQLWFEFGGVLYRILSQAVHDKWHNLYPVEEGFGRTDAIGRISNQVFAKDLLDPKNDLVGNAPVSYPAIWDAPKFDWVQYEGSVAQPLARNLGESLGVGAQIDLVDEYDRPLPPEQRFVSDSEIRNLVKIEDTLRKLEPPRWPDQILGKIDTVKAEKGRGLFMQHCARCHEPCVAGAAETAVKMPLKNPTTDPLWRMNIIPVEMVGTDPKAALNWVNHRVDLSKTGMTDEELRTEVKAILDERQSRMVAQKLIKAGDLDCEIQTQLDQINVKSAPIGAALNYVGILIKKQFYAQFQNLGMMQKLLSNLTELELNGYGALDIPQIKMAYKARPLAGVWATAPYLHNGSVPTLYEMLIPASQRTKRFFISRMYFDPVRVGLIGQPLSTHGFWFDTSIEGNQNIGHEFRAGYSGVPANGVIGPELTEDERWAIIEYLKIHEDKPGPCGPPIPDPQPVSCTR